jgi:hypothetical protein
MSFDFAELGATLAIGTYLLVGLELILFFLFNKTFWLPLPWPKDEKPPTRHTQQSTEEPQEKDGRKPLIDAGSAVVVAVCFVLGLLVEDISYKFADKARLQHLWLLPTEDDMRTDTLFGEKWKRCISKTGELNDRTKSAIAEFVPEPLAIELNDLGLLSRLGGKSGRKVIPLLTPEQSTYYDWSNVTENDFITTANAVYYEAKNTVYKEPNYFHEMNHIRMRIDFARAFSFVCILLVAMTICLYLLCVQGAIVPNFIISTQVRINKGT